MLTKEEEAYINGIELGIDWNIAIPKEQMEKYKELLEKDKKDGKEE